MNSKENSRIDLLLIEEWHKKNSNSKPNERLLYLEDLNYHNYTIYEERKEEKTKDNLSCVIEIQL